MSARITLDLEIGGRRLEAAELPGAADERPLILLHEGLGSVSTWREFPEALQRATSRRVIAFSRLGHGRSDPPPAPHTPTFFHEEALVVLPEVLRLLDADEPILVGHSDGGSIALIHASTSPVRGLVLMAAHVIVEDVTLEAIRETRERFEATDLRERLARHHDDPNVAFYNWCRRLARSGVPELDTRARCRASHLPRPPDPRGRRSLWHSRPARPDRVVCSRPGATAGRSRRAQPSSRCARARAQGDSGFRRGGG